MSAERPHRLRRWLIGSAIGLVVLVVGAFGALQYAVSRMPEYQARLQALVQERTGLMLAFRRIDASLRWYGPEVVFWGAVVSTPERQVLASARRGAVSLAWGRSLLERRVVIGRISLDGPEIGVVRTAEGKLKIMGFESPEPDRAPDLSRLPPGLYRVRDARIRFVDEQHGRQPWVLSNVALDLRRAADALYLDGSTDLPTQLGRDLRFNIRVSGDLARSQTWQTEAVIDADSLQLARWRESVAPDLMDTLQGVASLHVTTRWQGAALQDLKGKVSARDLLVSVPAWTVPIPAAAPLVIKPAEPIGATATTQAPAAEPPATKRLPAQAAFDRLQAQVELRRMRKEWRLQVNDLDFGKTDPAGRSARIEAMWTQLDGALDSVWVKADHLALDPLWPMLGWLPESEALARLRALELGGALDDLDVYYKRGQPGPTYHVQAAVRDLRFAPVGRVPGIAGLTARLDASERAGSLRIERAPLRFSWPSTFREPLTFDRLQGQLQWRRGEAGWLLDGDELELANRDGRAQAQLRLSLPGDGGSPQVELSADAYDLDARATPRYLPANHLGEKALEWLDHAFVAGRVPHAKLQLTGALRQFPFRNGGGDFHATADVRDLTLSYQPQWMPATQVQASVEFRNVGMRGRLQSGNIGGLALVAADARIDDFKQSVLAIKGNARGDVEHALRYLQTSPVGPAIGPMFMGLTGHGSGTYAVALTLPLKNLAARQVDVSTTLADGWVDHEMLRKPATRLNGSLRVVNTQIHSGTWRGQWLGGPFVATIEPQGQRSVLAAQGSLRANELAGLLRLPASVRLAGDSAWAGTLELGGASQSHSAAHVSIDLDGTSVALPAPLHKDADEHRPLTADVEIDAAAAYVRATFGTVRAVGRIAKAERGWRFDRAGVRPDGAVPSIPAHAGVRLEGRVDRLILDEWLALQSPPGTGSDGRRPAKVSDVLRAANLDIGELGLFGYRWQNVRGLLQAQDHSWRVDVSGPEVEGNLQVPYDFDGGAVLAADLELLAVSPRTTAAEGSASAQTDPRKLPSLQARVRDFTYEGHGLGELTLDLSRVPQGVRVDRLEVRGKNYQGTATGTWLAMSAGQETKLDMLFASTDVLDSLIAFNYSPFMQAKHAEVKGSLSWPGGIGGNWLARASGKVTVHVEQGQLLKLEPGAGGRVLGLLSFSALPRRLALDFSDLTGEGLSFDRIHGDFDIHDGDAYTDNLVVKGPATEIGLAGRTGLEAHDYDQTAVVTGKLGASPALAGALAGGPAVAAAVLLFSQIFKEPLKGVTRGYYRITGTWEEPVVERIHGAQAREAAEISRTIEKAGGPHPGAGN